MNKPKIVILTSNQLRHRYFCNELSKNLDVVGIVGEGKSAVITDFSKSSDEDQAIMNQNFIDRDSAEKLIFGTEVSFPETDILNIDFGEIYEDYVFDWINTKSPDVILLYGSSIIKDPILSKYDGRIINLHLGLSPYYKGSGTNFWPLVYNEPECVGITIHLAINKVDAGSILHQARPQMAAEDNAQIIGSKAIAAGVAALPGIIDAYLNGNISPLAQDLKAGKVFRNKDFSAAAVKQLWSNLEDGMIQKFLNNRDKRCSAFPIITYKN